MLTCLAKVASFCWQLELIFCTGLSDQSHHVLLSNFDFATTKTTCENLKTNVCVDFLCNRGISPCRLTESMKYNVKGEKIIQRESAYKKTLVLLFCSDL